MPSTFPLPGTVTCSYGRRGRQVIKRAGKTAGEIFARRSRGTNSPINLNIIFVRSSHKEGNRDVLQPLILDLLEAAVIGFWQRHALNPIDTGV